MYVNTARHIAGCKDTLMDTDLRRHRIFLAVEDSKLSVALYDRFILQIIVILLSKFFDV